MGLLRMSAGCGEGNQERKDTAGYAHRYHQGPRAGEPHRPSATTLSGGWDPQFLAGLETLTGHNEGARYPGHRGREPHKPPHELYEATQSDEAIATAARTLDYCKKPEHLLVQGPPRSLNTASSFLSWLPPTRRHPGRVGRTTYIHLFTFRIAASLNQVPGTTTAVSHLPDEQVKPVSQVPFEKHWHVSLPAGAVRTACAAGTDGQGGSQDQRRN